MKIYKELCSTRWILGSLICALFVFCIIGCESNNPSGPSDQSLSGASNTTASSTASVGNIVGQLVDIGTNQPLSETSANISISLYLGSTLLKTVQAVNNNFFDFSNLSPGFYNLKFSDSNNLYRTIYQVVEVNAGATSQVTVRLSRVPGSTVETADVYGQLVDSVNGAAIMFGTVGFLSAVASEPSFTTSTWGNGYFLLEKIPSGTWTIQFSKSNYQKATFELIVHGKDKVTFRNADVTSKTTISGAKGDGTDLTGFNIGKIQLAPAFTSTGGIAGRLRDLTTFKLLDSTKILVLFHRTVRSGVENPSYILTGFHTNDEGYIHLENLPEGYYTIADYGAIPIPINSGGNIVDWTIGDDPLTPTIERVYAGWLQVQPGKTTPLPSSGYQE